MPDNEEGFIPLDKVIELASRRKRKHAARRFGELSPAEQRNYLVKGIIPRTGVVVVWGPPKCGKSFWTSDVLLHVALGREYRGHKVQQGPVVYCVLEGAEGFKARAKAFRDHFGIEDAPFFVITEQIDLVAVQQELISDIRGELMDMTPSGQAAVPPAAVVLDTLNMSLAGSESNDEDMAKYVKAARLIAVTFNCVVLVVHHCGIDATRPRGHTSLTGACDAQLSVKRDTLGNIEVKVEYMKDGDYGEIITSKLEVVEVGKDVDGDAITSCIVMPVEGVVSTSKKKKLSDRATLALRLLGDAIVEHGKTYDNTRIPAGTGTVPFELFRSYVYDGLFSERDKPDTKKKALQRITDELQIAGRIGVWRELVWLAGTTGHAGT